MIRYTEEKKTAVLNRMMPPESVSVAKLSAELGISESCLYYWRMKARQKGALMPDSTQPPEQWSSASKFTVVLETARMTEAELSTYCRQMDAARTWVQQFARWYNSEHRYSGIVFVTPEREPEQEMKQAA